MLRAKPLENMGEGGDGASQAATPLLSANLPHSSIYKHQLPKKSGCLLSINRNHSPMVHLIMRPHTEPWLDAAHRFLGQPALNFSSRPTPTAAPTHRLEASGGLKEEGVLKEAADLRGSNRSAESMSSYKPPISMGSKPDLRINKGKYQRPHSETDNSSLHETLQRFFSLKEILQRSANSCLISA